MSNKNLFWGIVLMAIGVIFLLNNFHIMNIRAFFSTFWPLIFIFIGLKIILDRRRNKTSDANSVPVAADGIQRKADRLNENKSFGDITVTVVSQNFAGGTANNVFGDIKIDLSGAQIRNEECRLAVNSIFGDITIITPKGVPIRASTNAFAGDLLVKGERRDGIFPKLEYTEPGYEEKQVRLSLQGGIVFGSVNIF